ncbi:SpoIIE family protein phosphatase [Streptomyces daliensis]
MTEHESPTASSAERAHSPAANPTDKAPPNGGGQDPAHAGAPAARPAPHQAAADPMPASVPAPAHGGGARERSARPPAQRDGGGTGEGGTRGNGEGKGKEKGNARTRTKRNRGKQGVNAGTDPGCAAEHSAVPEEPAGRTGTPGPPGAGGPGETGGPHRPEGAEGPRGAAGSAGPTADRAGAHQDAPGGAGGAGAPGVPAQGAPEGGKPPEPAAPAAPHLDSGGDSHPDDRAAPPLADPATAAAAAMSESAERERRGGDRLRFVGAATRRIARGIDLDETVLGLCRASVPAYSDAILVYLRDPLPVGDERPTGPVVLRLRRSDRIPEDPQSAARALAAQARVAEAGTGTGAGSGSGSVSGAVPDSGSGAAPGSAFGGDAGAGDAGGEPAQGLSLLSAVPDGTSAAAEFAEVRAGGPLAEVLRGVRPVFADAPAARAALPELLGTGRDVPSGNRAILAPLRGRRRVIGAAVFLRRPERPAFEPDDLLIAAQLATHTALGVDKAVLYGREAYIADELQRTMLPDELPQPTGCQLASRYLPAAETARVGGDWYDAIPLPGSRVALVVGDVMGHSMTSAAIMGQLRTTAQTLAGLDLPPQEVLHHLDEQAQRLGSDRMATCLYAVYDPVAHRIVVANAGHPPPVMLHRGGRAEVLRIPAGAPIGVGGVDFEAVELDAPAGATLLLYTDGLVESRQRDVWTGIEHLREKLAATARLTRPDASAPLEPLCDEVLDILGPGDRDDDIALLAARFDGIAPSDVAYWFLDPRAQTAGQARRLARRALARWDLEELTDSVELLVSEVVTNAVRYAERPITLRLLRTDTLRCEVGDDVPQLPRLRQARATDEGGRGLYLVNKMARRWGATRLSTGKVVWFELALP